MNPLEASPPGSVLVSISLSIFCRFWQLDRARLKYYYSRALRRSQCYRRGLVSPSERKEIKEEK